jgi:heavy metal sensor kinase
MRSARPERPFATLRFRLTFWNTLVLWLLGAATLIGLREGLRYTLSNELNRLLDEDAREVGLVLEQFHPDAAAVDGALERKARGHADRDWFAQVLTPSGRLLYESPGVPALDWPASPEPRPFNRGDYRVLQRPLDLPGVPPLVVRVGSGLRYVTEDVDTLTRILATAGGVILLVAPLTGFWLAGRATRPLRTIIATTERLRPNALAERLPLRGTGDELDRLSVTVNGFLDRLADHLRRQRDFVANAAHELRSPLTALRTSIEVALQRERAPAEYQELLADLAEEAAALSGLINQMLLLAEGDAERLKPGRGVVPLDALAARAVDMFQGVAEQRGVGLALAGAAPVAVRGDAAHVRQVIHNLLDNAIKFTPAGGKVEVAVGPGAADRAVLTVRDTGIGIAPADLPHVFDRFFRADRARSRDGESRGTGLGLSICQTVVTAYGGRLAVASAPGRGTTVTVDLPRAGDGEKVE